MRDTRELSAAFDADVKRQQEATRALVRAIHGSQMPPLAGHHGKRSIEELAADSGFSSGGHAELSPVLIIKGRPWR